MRARFPLAPCPCALVLLGSISGCADLAELGVYTPFDGGGDTAETDSAADAAAAEPDVTPLPSVDAGSWLPQDDAQASSPSADASAPANSDDFCFDLTAQSAQGAAYDVRAEGDGFVRFTVPSPMPTARSISSVSPIIGNGIVLHDMRLYQHAGALPPGLTHGKARGLDFVYSWAPGSREVLPESGIITSPDLLLTLEVHYVLGTVSSATDSSGLHICLSTRESPLPLSYARLGSENFAGQSAQGTCTPSLAQPVQIMAVRPAMNAHGEHAKLVLRRSTGEQLTLYDAPYAFDEEALSYLMLPLPEVHPGDSLLSTCSYSQAVSSGQGDQDEFCEFHVLHTPAGALVSAGERDTCLQ